jgi:hypothetical protein
LGVCEEWRNFGTGEKDEKEREEGRKNQSRYQKTEILAVFYAKPL